MKKYSMLMEGCREVVEMRVPERMTAGDHEHLYCWMRRLLRKLYTYRMKDFVDSNAAVSMHHRVAECLLGDDCFRGDTEDALRLASLVVGSLKSMEPVPPPFGSGTV